MSERSAIACRRSSDRVLSEDAKHDEGCSGSDALLTAPGNASIYRGSPLKANRLNRLVAGEHPSCRGRKLYLSFWEYPPWPDKSGRFPSFPPYRANVAVPEGCYSSSELDRIRTTILSLNPFIGVPVTRFQWEPRNKEDMYSMVPEYWPESHSIYLSHQPETGALVPRIEGTIAEVVDSMGNALYEMRFAKDPDWDEVYLRALGFRNYEILDDSNYLVGSSDSIGHPWHNAQAAFASAVYVYFAHADQFAAFIRNEETPEVMRTFGKLAWTFMRDRVFRGFVLTSNGLDPFSGSSFPALLRELPGKRGCLTDLFSNDPKAMARWAGARRLNNDPIPEAAPALQIARKDNHSLTAETARTALWKIFPR